MADRGIVIGRTVVAIVVAAWLLAPPPRALAQPPVGAASLVLNELNGVGELRSVFDSDREKIRVVLLLSPT